MISRQCLRRVATVIGRASRPAPRYISTFKSTPISPLATRTTTCQQSQVLRRRRYATSTRSEADIKMDGIQDQYATAKDEFEIAVEETEKKTVYAEGDREAAKEEFNKLKDIYESYLKDSSPDVAAEIKQRAGQRIRELDEALKGLDASLSE